MCQSLYSEHCKCLAHSENLLKAHSLIAVHLSIYLPVLCTSALLHQVQQTWAVYSYTTYQLMLPCRWELFIDSRVTVAFDFVSSDFFFFISHSYCAHRRIHWGEGERRKRKEMALCCFLLIPGHSSPCSNSPTKPSGYFLIPLDDFQMFWLGENLQFNMKSNTLVAAGKSPLCFIKFPQ